MLRKKHGTVCVHNGVCMNTAISCHHIFFPRLSLLLNINLPQLSFIFFLRFALRFLSAAAACMLGKRKCRRKNRTPIFEIRFFNEQNYGRSPHYTQITELFHLEERTASVLCVQIKVSVPAFDLPYSILTYSCPLAVDSVRHVVGFRQCSHEVVQLHLMFRK